MTTIFVPAHESTGSYALSSHSIDLQALRESSQQVSPFALERSHSHGTAGLHTVNALHSITTLHKIEQDVFMPADNKFRSSPNVYHGIVPQMDTDPKTPHHITSIHPNLRSRRRFKNKSEDFGWHDPSTQEAWDSSTDHTPHRKKPLGESLKNIRIGPDSPKPMEEDPVITNQAHSSKEHVSITRQPATTKKSADRSGHDEAESRKSNHGHPESSGCLVCDKCFPGGRLTVIPLIDSLDYTGIPPKERDLAGSVPSRSAKNGHHSLLSWFRSKKKYDHRMQKVSAPSEQNTHTLMPLPSASNEAAVSVIIKPKVKAANAPDDKYKDLEMAVNTMKEEVFQANRNRDAALAEVSELKLAIQEMGKKIGQLENHYQKIGFPSKRRIGDTQPEDHQYEDASYDPPRVSSSWGIVPTDAGPTKREFCHAVVEARVGVKQFVRTLLQQLRQQSALDKISTMLQAQMLGHVNSTNNGSGTVSRRIKYLIESIINQTFYEDFENIKFKKSGSHCVLDPWQRPMAFYKTYLGIAQVGWSDMVRKDSSVYSENFDGFCDEKMSKLVEEVLYWDLEGGWTDELVEAFFRASKWVWLLHLLAFSFKHPATIFRVGTEAHYDPLYMEELPSVEHSRKNGRRKRSYGHHGKGESSEQDQVSSILAMVMPGFFFNSYEVIRCKVLLSSVHELL